MVIHGVSFEILDSLVFQWHLQNYMQGDQAKQTDAIVKG